jgi:hypothetical protein
MPLSEQEETILHMMKTISRLENEVLLLKERIQELTWELDEKEDL